MGRASSTGTRRQTISGSQRLITSILAFFMILCLRSCDYLYQQARRREAMETALAQKAERNAQARAAAEEVRSQPLSDDASRFAETEDVLAIEVPEELVFQVPASWAKDDINIDSNPSYRAPKNAGWCQAGMTRDFCIASTSAEDALDRACRELTSLDVERDKVVQGTLGDALWYRYPIYNAGEDDTYPHYGYLEIILSGNDEYHLVLLCPAVNYTRSAHVQMLRILNSVSGPSEAPLFNDLPATEDVTEPADGDGMLAFLASCGDFRTYTVTGEGSQLVHIPQWSDSLAFPYPCLITIDYGGDETFQVRLSEDADDQGIALVEHSGPYHGTVTNLSDVSTTNACRWLDVRAEGGWSITFAPLRTVQRASNGASCMGDTLVYLDEPSSGYLLFNHAGSGSFVVYAVSVDRSEMLIDTTGPYEDGVAWNEPDGLFIVHSEGEWSVTW